MSTDNETVAPHLRLHEFAVKHLHQVLANLRGGKIGFDPNRDERTNSKDKLVAFILDNHTAVGIDEAHEAAVEKYGEAKRSRRRKSAGSQTTTDATASKSVETSADGDDDNKSGEAEVVVPKITAGNDAASQMAALIQQLAGPSVDEAKLAALVDKAVAKALESQTMRHEIVCPELPPVKVGIQHKNFPLLLRACNARLRDGSRLNVWLAGPAGSGKTTAAKNVAEGLNLPFRFNGAIDQPYKLTGYMDANGNYHTTAFRDAWENGGVYLFDEVDASSPAAVLEFNAALANGLASFPDQPAPIPRHADCIVVAGANTTGQGGTTEYVGRMRQDAAFLDRFVVIDWPIDEQLERTIGGNVEWTSRVQMMRANVKSKGLKGHMISPRATVYGEALLAAGMSQKDVDKLVLRKGIKSADWRLISE